MNSRSTQGRRRRAFIDLVVLVILAVLAFLAASAFDAFEALHRWSRQHESWEVDEFFTAIAIATIVLAVFSFRRWQDTAHEARRRSRAEEAVRKTHDELDAQVKERTGALWASEEKYRTLLENSGELIQSVDAEGRFVYVNPQWCQTLGYTSEETRQLRFTDVLRPDQVEHCRGVFSSLQQGISVLHVETVFVSKDGREIFVEGTATPTFREGRFVHTQGFFHDVTERKRAEESAERSEERFRLLFEYAPDAYYLNDLTGTFVDGNKAAQEMTGYKKEEMIGKNFLRLNLLPPMQIPRAAALLAKNVLGRPTGPDELTLNRKDGTQVSVEIRTTPIRIKNQTLVLGIARDITERKRAEQALRESEERLSHILESAMDAIITINDARRIVLFNEAAEMVFRCPAAEAIGQPIDRFLSESFGNLLTRDLQDFGKHKITKQYMSAPEGLTAIRANGEEFPIEATISQVEVSGQKLYTIILRDIDERKQAEAELNKLQIEKDYLQEEIKTEYNFREVIGASAAMKKMFQNIEKVATTDSTVLLTGETGAGKELLARVIHNLSNRKDKVMVKVNCTALPAGLVESELFGHEKGAFTGATTKKKGRFELANGGTIFLDEIGELPLETQTKLLRVLQEQEFERVGGTQTQKVNVRVIAASNRNLEEDVKHGAFRTDLFYRLNVFPIHIPPLRERIDDIPLLINYFIKKFSHRMGKKIQSISPKAQEKLMSYDWPGNVRELANILERAVILCEGRLLQQEHIGISIQHPTREAEISTLEEVEGMHIQRALEKTAGVVGGPHGAATLLGIKRTTLIDRMRKLGIYKNARV
ncbi:PAS domain S-box protein [candidate division KSB1 bacterium]|nr:PAS domain S-box protein [candidate division KSB1 bacterium]